MLLYLCSMFSDWTFVNWLRSNRSLVGYRLKNDFIRFGKRLVKVSVVP